MADQKVSIAITALTDGAEKGIKAISGSLSGLGKDAKDLTGSMSGLSGAVSALGVGFVLTEVINAALKMEALTRQFQVFTGSASLAAREMEFVKTTANTLGLDVLSLTGSYALFMNAVKGTANEGQKARDAFTGISEGMAAVGMNADMQGRAWTQLNQGIMKGKFELEDLKTINEAGLPIFKLMADALGVSTAEFMKMQKEGKILADDVLPLLGASMHQAYSVAAVNGAESAQGAINKMNNAMLESKAVAGSSLMPVFTDLVLYVFTPLVALIGDVVKGLQSMAAAGALAANQLMTGLGGIFSGKAFTKTGYQAIMAESLENESIYKAAMEKIWKAPTSTDYTAAETASQKMKAENDKIAKALTARTDATKKAQKDIDNAKKAATADWMAWNSDDNKRIAAKEEARAKAVEAAKQKGYQETSDIYQLTVQDMDNAAKKSAEKTAAWQEANLDDIKHQVQAANDLAAALQLAYDRSAYGGMMNAMFQYADETANIGHQMETTFLRAFDNMEDAITDFVKTGKLSFRDLFDQLQTDLIRMTISKPLTNYVGSQLQNLGSYLGSSGTSNTGSFVSPEMGGTGSYAGAAAASYAIPVAGIALAMTSYMYTTLSDQKKRHAQERAEQAEAQRLLKTINQSVLSSRQSLEGNVYAGQITKTKADQQAARDNYVSQMTAAFGAMGTNVISAITEGTYDQKRQQLVDIYNQPGYTANQQMWAAEALKMYDASNEAWKNLMISQGLELEQLGEKQISTTGLLKMQELELLGLKDSAAYTEALTNVRKAESLTLDKNATLINGVMVADENSAYAIQQRIYVLQDEKTAIEALTAAISNTVNYALAAANAIKEIQGGSLSTDSPEMKYQKAKAAFAGATNLNAPDLAKELLGASQQYNASGAAYQADYAAVMAKLRTIAGMTPGTAVDPQITLLGQIRDALTDGTKPYIKDLKTGDIITTIISAAVANSGTQSDIDASMQAKASAYANTALQMGSGKIATDLRYDLNKSGAVDTGDAILWLSLAQGKMKWSDLGLPAFALGGITNGPSIAGEGRYKEAVIPLPDGRSVPVTMNGSADNKETVAELKEQNRLLRALLGVSQAGFTGVIDVSERQEKRLAGVETRTRISDNQRRAAA